MATETTRRTFLTSSAAGLAAMTAAGKLRASDVGDTTNRPQQTPTTADSIPQNGAEIASWVTNDKVRFSRSDSIRWRPASATPSAGTIMLNPENKFQDILGFGAAFTDGACFTFNQLEKSKREDLFHELFHPSQMALNVCRTCIGASDYSIKVFGYDEGDPDPELTRFSIEHDREYILPILREARKANPNLFLFSSPWSPPGWMKSGGSMLGGAMRRHYLRAYAQYFVKFVQSYAAEGVPVQAVTVQNEVDTDQDGRMPACIWPQEYEIGLVHELGPLLEQNGLKVNIWILDHNYNLWGRAICELDDPAVRKYANSIAWHGYVGTPEMMSKVHDAHPDAEMYWTEGGPDFRSPDYSMDWVKWGETFTTVLRNWCRSITGWNLALDENGRPNIGPFGCGGLVTIDSHTKEISRSGQYWGFAHFSRAIQTGARRFESSSPSAKAMLGVSHAAFENPDGTRVLVVTNSGESQTAAIQIGTMKANLALDPNSIATFVWQ
jgi:glucosylceramidase